MKNFLILKAVSNVFLNTLIFTILPLIVFTLLTSRSNLIPSLNSYTVLTGSMEPLIPVGSMVYFLKADTYMSGDIISFEKGKLNITHRIVSTVDASGNKISNLKSPLARKNASKAIFYQTKGDANEVADTDLVPAENVIGKAIFHFPYIGGFVVFLKSVPGFFAFIIFPTLIFIGFELWNIKKEIEKETEKRILKRLGAYG